MKNFFTTKVVVKKHFYDLRCILLILDDNTNK